MDQDSHTGIGQETASHGYGSAPDTEATYPRGSEGRPSTGAGAGSEAAHADDIGRVRSFLEDQLRERPLPTLLLGVLAGWLAGKLLR